jgi:hypothetical protein
MHLELQCGKIIALPKLAWSGTQPIGREAMQKISSVGDMFVV